MAIGTSSDPMNMGQPTMKDMFSKPEPEQEESKPEQEEVQAPQEDKGEVYLYLESLGGPNKEQVEAWKTSFGGVHLIPLDDDSVYIYRSLKRSEWNALKAQFMSAGESMSEDQKKETIVSKCLLWPPIHGTEYAFTEAGLVDTLYEAISVSSYFLSPQMIMNMVMRL